MTALICIPCLLTGGIEIQTLNLVGMFVLGIYRLRIVICSHHGEDNVREIG